jgi:hypothetical protein
MRTHSQIPRRRRPLTSSRPSPSLPWKPVRKKPEVGEKRVYWISRKFFGFIVFLSDKNLEKKLQFIQKQPRLIPNNLT